MKTAVLLVSIMTLSIGARAATAVAKVSGTASGSPISGTVTFEDGKKGLKIIAKLAGLPPGEHGFHIHEFGSCEDGGKAAGGHYNPLGVKHGDAMKDGMKQAHAGDLGNITVAGDGTVGFETVLPKLAVSGGKFNVAGRAVIIHEKADDFGQPVGNAGGRIGCGAIAIAAN